MNAVPFQLYGNWFEQIVAFVVLVSIEFTTNSSVTIESQPETLLSVSLYVPAAVIVLPFQLYGNWFEQIVIPVVLVRIGFTTNSSVAIESQPETLLSVSLYVPAAVIVLLFQLYGNWFEQMVVFVVLVRIEFTTNSSVAIESQPETLLNVSLYVPAAVIVFPFQLYGS